MRRRLPLFLALAMLPFAVGSCAAEFGDAAYCARGEAAIVWSDGHSVNRLQIVSREGDVGDIEVPLSDISATARLDDGRVLLGADKDEQRQRLAVFNPRGCTVDDVGSMATVGKGIAVKGSRVWTFGERGGVDVVQELDDKFTVRRSKSLLGMSIRAIVPVAKGVLVIGEHALSKGPRAILLEPETLEIAAQNPLPDALADVTSAVAYKDHVFVGMEARGQGGSVGVLTGAGAHVSVIPVTTGAEPTRLQVHGNHVYVFHRPQRPDPNEHDGHRLVTVVDAGTLKVTTSASAPFSIDAEAFAGEALWTVQADREGVRVATHNPSTLAQIASTAIKVQGLRPGEGVRGIIPLR